MEVVLDSSCVGCQLVLWCVGGSWKLECSAGDSGRCVIGRRRVPG